MTFVGLSLVLACNIPRTGPLPDARAPDANGPSEGPELSPECRDLGPLRLSDPRLAGGGRLVRGQPATVEVTLTNTGSVDYSKYPGALMAPAPTNVSLVSPQAGVALLGAGQSRTLSWKATVPAAAPPGTTVEFKAHVIGAGRLDCPNAHGLSFSFPVE